MNRITVQELARRRNSNAAPQQVDVRSTAEYRAGHIPGAINIPMETLEQRRGDLDTRNEIVLICQSGMRAAQVYTRLQEPSLRLVVLDGGTVGWSASGLPLISEQATSWSLDRQIRFAAGLLVLTGTLGSIMWAPLLGLAVFVGAGLTFSGLTNWCGMGLLLAKMPWNRAPCPKQNVLQNTTGGASK